MVNSSFIQFRALLARQQVLQQQHHRRLAGRIHDEVSQKLTLLALQLSLAALADKPPTNWAQKCQNWNTMIVELGGILRDISNELRPRILDDQGLVEALRWFSSSRPAGVFCQFKGPAEPVALPPVASNEVFVLCREIVADIFAPNGVTGITIELEQASGELRLELRVESAKPGFEPLTLESLDPLSIHERLACIDGVAAVDHQPGRGFVVTLSVQSAQRPACVAA